jgi:hypothetical protein
MRYLNIIAVVSVFLLLTAARVHPVYVSVTSIEYNKKQELLEVSCKLFIDDMEKFLKGRSGRKIDFLHPDREGKMDSLLSAYLTAHLSMEVNGVSAPLTYEGFESEGDVIYVYLEADGIKAVNRLEVTNSILYDYKPAQVSVINVKVGDNKQGKKMMNPEDKAVFLF